MTHTYHIKNLMYQNQHIHTDGGKSVNKVIISKEIIKITLLNYLSDLYLIYSSCFIYYLKIRFNLIQHNNYVYV